MPITPQQQQQQNVILVCVYNLPRQWIHLIYRMLHVKHAILNLLYSMLSDYLVRFKS